MAGIKNMADEKQSGGNGLVVLVVAAVGAAYFAWQKPQLEGFRPAKPYVKLTTIEAVRMSKRGFGKILWPQ